MGLGRQSRHRLRVKDIKVGLGRIFLKLHENQMETVVIYVPQALDQPPGSVRPCLLVPTRTYSSYQSPSLHWYMGKHLPPCGSGLTHLTRVSRILTFYVCLFPKTLMAQAAPAGHNDQAEVYR